MAEAQQSLGGGASVMREYRKGNWTLQETMVLIEAKKMDDERRQMKRLQQNQQQQQHSVVVKGATTELRWKWVEDYCWSKGCYRSQNQCNDKWDNLMRDYKKLRDFHRSTSPSLLHHNQQQQQQEDKMMMHQQLSSSSSAATTSSYWNMERSERKEKNLPTNMSPQIYDALLEVVERNTTNTNVLSPPPQPPPPLLLQPPPGTGGGSGGYFSVPMLPAFTTTPLPPVAAPVKSPSPVGHQPQPPQPASPPSDPSSSQAKRRRTTSIEAAQETRPHDEEQVQGPRDEEDEFGRRTSHQPPSTAPLSSLHEMGSAISRGASAIADAIRENGEREERRHREMVSLQERRLEIESSKLEMGSAMVEAMNTLANSILSLANSHSGKVD